MKNNKELKVEILKSETIVTYSINGSIVFQIKCQNKNNFEYINDIPNCINYRLQSEPDLTLISKVKVEQNDFTHTELLSITSIYSNDKS